MDPLQPTLTLPKPTEPAAGLSLTAWTFRRADTGHGAAQWDACHRVLFGIGGLLH